VLQDAAAVETPAARFAALHARLRAQDAEDTALARSKRHEARAARKAKLRAAAADEQAVGVQLGDMGDEASTGSGEDGRDVDNAGAAARTPGTGAAAEASSSEEDAGTFGDDSEGDEVEGAAGVRLQKCSKPDLASKEALARRLLDRAIQ
jgi:hypothetical protein